MLGSIRDPFGMSGRSIGYVMVPHWVPASLAAIPALWPLRLLRRKAGDFAVVVVFLSFVAHRLCGGAAACSVGGGQDLGLQQLHGLAVVAQVAGPRLDHQELDRAVRGLVALAEL